MSDNFNKVLVAPKREFADIKLGHKNKIKEQDDAKTLRLKYWKLEFMSYIIVTILSLICCASIFISGSVGIVFLVTLLSSTLIIFMHDTKKYNIKLQYYALTKNI